MIQDVEAITVMEATTLPLLDTRDHLDSLTTSAVQLLNQYATFTRNVLSG